MSENTAVSEEAQADDLYRYVDSEGRKRATAQGSREHLEHEKFLAAAEKARIAEESHEPEVSAPAAAEKSPDSTATVVDQGTVPPVSNPTKPPAVKTPPAKADPKV
jgi:hypothetical protein